MSKRIDELMNRVVVETLIENLERRQQEIVADINEALEQAAYNNSVRLNWDYEDYEDSEDDDGE